MSDPPTDPSAARPTGEPPNQPANSVSAGVDATSDEMLLLGARLRDETALAMLYDRYGGLLYTLALRIVGERDLAEDVVQDVFLRCWHGLEPYDDSRGTLAGWMIGITRGRAVDLLGGRQHHGRASERASLTKPGESATAAADLSDEGNLRADVGGALAELAESQRAAIELAYYGGLTQTEVADQLGEPIGAVKTRIRDGLRRLRRLLAPVVEAGTARGIGTA